MASKKGRQSSHNKEAHKYERQYVRTVNHIGRWRGKKPDEYVKYKKVKRIKDSGIRLSKNKGFHIVSSKLSGVTNKNEKEKK